MRSLGVNSSINNLMNVPSRVDVEIDFASIDIMKVKENRKLGSVERTIGWMVIVNLKAG